MSTKGSLDRLLRYVRMGSGVWCSMPSVALDGLMSSPPTVHFFYRSIGVRNIN